MSRGVTVVEHVAAAAANPSQDDLFVARAVLKRAIYARDAAHVAHVNAQHAVDEARALVRRLERGR